LAAYFFDSSAVVKRYVAEPGTTWVSHITTVAGSNPVYIARLTLVEVISAITRKVRGTSLTAALAVKALTDFRNDFLSQYAPVELTPRLIERAADLAQTHALRGYDAVQLAAALEINLDRMTAGFSAIPLISADTTLNAVAVAEGLAVDDPNEHP
jgi:predicted nucleic acid-binding protein